MNYDLIEAQNRVKNWEWVIGDNSHPSRSTEPLDAKKFPALIKCFDQSNLDDMKPYFREGGYYRPELYKKRKLGCYWHGAALNKLLEEVKTRFLLVLDNNFYVVRQDWINDSLEHMKKNNLAFFGAPNPPSNPVKYRYFPEVHCFFVDLNKVKPEELDFIPAYELLSPLSAIKRQVRIAQVYLDRKAPDIVSKIFDIALADHLRVGRSGDVGARIASRYGGRSGFEADCVQQIFNPSLVYKLSDIFFPERLSLIPKRRGYYAPGVTFLPGWHTKYGAKNWEAYKWKDKPFGFHIRAKAYSKLKTASQWEELFKGIGSILEEYEHR